MLLAYSVEVKEVAAAKGINTTQEPPYKQHVSELRRCIDAAADFETQNSAHGFPRGKIWSAVKMSALVPEADTLERFSTYLCATRPDTHIKDVPSPHSPHAKDLSLLGVNASSIPEPLTHKDVESIKALYEDLRALCFKAQEKGIPLIFDAEHTWYQVSSEQAYGVNPTSITNLFFFYNTSPSQPLTPSPSH